MHTGILGMYYYSHIFSYKLDANWKLVLQFEFLKKYLLLVATTAKIRQLVVDRKICCCSQFMIFLLELLGQAIGCLAGPSSSNRKIMD